MRRLALLLSPRETGRARRIAGMVVVTGALILGTGIAAAPNQPARRDPFTLFQQLVPVIQHDRCVNCHGGVDPISGRGHKDGPVDPAMTCDQCHSDAAAAPATGHWHTPQPFDFFAGKDAKALCAQFADFAMNRGKADFKHHVEHDSLIALAFIGLIGGARTPGAGNPPDPPADPPPMTHRAWADSAMVWHDEGFAACTMDGTIFQEETINSDSTHHHGHQAGQHSGSYMDTRLVQSGTRQVRVTRLSNGQYRANLSVSWQATNTIVQQMIAPNGLCTVTITGNIKHDGTSSGAAVVNVRTRAFPRFVRYFIDVELPPERTTQHETSAHTTNCPGARLGDAPPSSLVQSWPKRQFTIEGELLDPNDKRLVGGCDEVLVDGQPRGGARACFQNLDTPNPIPFIEHVGQPSNLDGSSLPVRVHTAWNFMFR